MIIKSLQHKQRVEAQLIDYLDSGAEPGYFITQGLGSSA